MKTTSPNDFKFPNKVKVPFITVFQHVAYDFKICWAYGSLKETLQIENRIFSWLTGSVWLCFKNLTCTVGYNYNYLLITIDLTVQALERERERGREIERERGRGRAPLTF